MPLNIITQQINSELKTGANGLELSRVAMSVIFQDETGATYFSGQVTLTAEDDGISFTSTLDDFKKLAISKTKTMVDQSIDAFNTPVDSTIETTEG